MEIPQVGGLHHRYARFAANQFRSGRFEAIEMKLNFARDHIAFAIEDPSHIRGYWTRLDAVLTAVPREPICFCAADHVLAAQACNVRAHPPMYFRSTRAVRCPAWAKFQVRCLPA